jgi:translation initiation factor 1
MSKDRPRDARPVAQGPAAKPSSASPFARLEALRSSLPAGPTGAAQATPAPDGPPRGPARAVVRMERKGRGGKEVTVVDKLGLGPAALETWCRDLKQALGCGGSVDGELIVLQGDLRARAPAVLTARGVAKVTVG